MKLGEVPGRFLRALKNEFDFMTEVFRDILARGPYGNSLAIVTMPNPWPPLIDISSDKFEELQQPIADACFYLDTAPRNDPSRVIIKDLLDVITNLKGKVERLQIRKSC